MENHPQSTQDSISDCESGVSGTRIERRSPSPELFPVGSSLIKLGEEDRAHRVVKQRFLSSSGLNPPAEVVAIHRRGWSVPSAQTNLLAFQIYLRAIAAKNSGDANVKYAWFGASKSGISKIVAHGFGHEEINQSSGAVYGRGVYLSPDASPLASVQSAVEDEDGVRHILFCRVLLGNVEAIQPGSIQTHASSDRFDSGVDDVVCPKRYVLWSTNINTHILPEVVVSFRAVVDIPAAPAPIPTSSWMSFHDLFEALSALLNPHAICSVKERYKDFAEKRISRDELVRCIRRVAGDNLLACIIKSSNPEGRDL